MTKKLHEVGERHKFLVENEMDSYNHQGFATATPCEIYHEDTHKFRTLIFLERNKYTTLLRTSPHPLGKGNHQLKSAEILAGPSQDS